MVGHARIENVKSPAMWLGLQEPNINGLTVYNIFEFGPQKGWSTEIGIFNNFI